MLAAFFSKLLLGVASFPLVSVHPWSNRSIAAYFDHVAHYRHAKSLQSESSGSWWDRFRPAFVCPWIDRLGRISDGGKWVCHWQALLTTATDAPPCVIYSFGVSNVRDLPTEVPQLIHFLTFWNSGIHTLHFHALLFCVLAYLQSGSKF